MVKRTASVARLGLFLFEIQGQLLPQEEYLDVDPASSELIVKRK